MKRIKFALIALLLLAGTATAGGLLYVGGSYYQDSFNRSDANPIDGPWTVVSGYDNVQITSNEIRGSNATGYSRISFDGISSGNDVWSEVEYRSGSENIEIIIRYTAATTYRYGVVCNAGTGTFKLRKIYSGGTVDLWDSGGRTWTQGDVVRVWAKGNTQKVYLNGALQTTQSDTDVPSGDTPIVISVYNNNTYMDNWRGGVSQ